MSEISNSSTTETERPTPSSEQMRAFRGAYSALMELSAGNYGEDMALAFDPKTGRVEEAVTAEDKDEPEPNGVGVTVLVDLSGAERYSWARIHGEDLSRESSMLGSFAATASESGDEQDHYGFYPDGNIERIHWVMGGEEDSPQGTDDRWTHVNWLTPEETDQLATVIESGHFTPTA